MDTLRGAAATAERALSAEALRAVTPDACVWEKYGREKRGQRVILRSYTGKEASGAFRN